ncbi:MAG: SAM-dependent methyltransferase, partial [Aridibacter sp.]
MSSIPLKINLYLFANEKIKDSPPWLKAIFKGFWLGILSRRELQIIDRIYYEQTENYCDETYNKSGFLDWE